MRPNLIGSALRGSWRDNPPAPQLSAAELNEIAPLLTGSGTAALCWWAVRSSELCEEAEALALKQAYRLYTLRSAVSESHIKKAISLLRSEGIEPLLLKGWANARLYPETGLRPYSDIDLLVRPEHHELALRLMDTDEGRRYGVDLQHAEFSRLTPAEMEGL
ncbi:MAG TPA: nucleotidyltransferase family protein, partial [Pyrinomonadaceae bacterium]